MRHTIALAALLLTSTPALAEQSAAEKAVELRLQQAEKAEQARQQRDYKVFGDCVYHWAGWKLTSQGTRQTTARCGGRYVQEFKGEPIDRSSIPSSIPRLGSLEEVAVNCSTLKISIRYTISLRRDNWSEWQLPKNAERGMVVKLCGNLPHGQQ